MKKKKLQIMSLLLVMVLCVGLLAGCGSTDSGVQQESGNEKFNVVCTVFPEYDWVREVIGDNMEAYELTLLTENGVDLHSYQPTAKDIAKIGNCDLLLYVGGESDKWVRDALKETTNKNMQVINLLEVLGDEAKEEEIVEGMESEEEHEGEEEGPEYDEHVWLSLKNAKLFTKAICEALSKLDEEHSEDYQTNLSNYNEKLSALDKEYEAFVEAGDSGRKTVVFGDRFPFLYLMDDYDVDYYAAFPGCSAESEASFETITFLANKVDEFGLSKILVIDGSNQKIAQTIVSNTKDKNQEILALDSLQSVTKQDIQSGTTYLKVMESNLEILKQALK